jgi:DNA invertase Pin-like site-specific DNA recombinase
VQLEALIDFAREGDVLIVTKLDRLARSVRDLMAIVDRLAAKGVGLRILALDLDTSTATGKLMLTILGGIAEFERELMLERQREGIAKAKAEKKYKGRAPTARAKAAEINALLRQNLGPKEISRRLAISRSSVYRVIEHSGLGHKHPHPKRSSSA